VRERIRREMGTADNQVIWWMDARPEENDEATSELLTGVYRVMDDWVLTQLDEGTTAAAAKPTEAVDGCWSTDGELIASGEEVWNGSVELAVTGDGAWSGTAPSEVDGVPVGDCASRFPINSTSRVIAGGPITNDVYKCHLKPVTQAVSDGDYGSWTPTESELAELERIFPDGVCDWSKRSVGYPDGESALGADEPDAELTATTTTAGVGSDDGLAPGPVSLAALVLLAMLIVGGALVSGRGDSSRAGHSDTR